jgi:hypothetical protein
MPDRKLPTAVLLVASLAFGAVGAAGGLTAQAAELVPDKAAAEPQGPKAIYQLDQFGPRKTDNAALRWSEQTLALIRSSKLPPTAVSRVLAVVQTSVYDAWAAYDPVAVGTRLGGSLRRPAEERTVANKSKAISYAAYRALLDLFPDKKDALDAFMRGFPYDPADTSTDRSKPQGIGNVAAQAVIDARRNDGSNQGGGYADYAPVYTPVNTPDTVVDKWRWQPLRLPNGTEQKFATPHWGRVIPFALTRPDQFAVDGPDLRKDYKKSVNDVVKFSAQLTDTDKVISEYWSDGPATELPPGHGAVFAGALCRMRGDNLDDDVKLLFIQANAVLDAGIAVWHFKRKHDFVRPITLVHVLKKGEKIKAWGGPGKGTVWMLGEQWRPYQPVDFVTPPFAEYVSGHSTFTGATFEVLRSFTGSDRLNLSVTVGARTSRIESGTPAKPVKLTWRTMQDAADQAGISREYGGIHFREGDLHGRALGTKIGQAVFAKSQAYFNGTATS